MCGTTLTASIDTARTGFAATETAIIREGLQSILPGPHSLPVDGATPHTHQTASKFPFRWRGANSTVSDRHQLDEPPGLYSAQNEALDVSEPMYANSRGYTHLVRSASFPTRVNGILARFAHMARTSLTPVGSLADSPEPHGDEAHMSRRALESVVWKLVSRLNRWAGIMLSGHLGSQDSG